MRLLELFCDVDDFLLSVAPNLKATQIVAGNQRQRPEQWWASSIMTILIHFHQSHYQPFKAYDTEHVHVYLSSEFPHLVSYPRVASLISTMLVPLLAYLQSCYGACTGISFIDDLACSLQSQTHPSASGLCRRCQARQILNGLVLWLCSWQSMIRANCWPVA